MVHSTSYSQPHLLDAFRTLHLTANIKQTSLKSAANIQKMKQLVKGCSLDECPDGIFQIKNFFERKILPQRGNGWQEVDPLPNILMYGWILLRSNTLVYF